MNVQEIASTVRSSHAGFVLSWLSRWVPEVPAFSSFLTVNESKIRHKLANANTNQDVIAELDVARRLLAQANYSVFYEPYDTGTTRSPDFLVTNPKFPDFNVEVKRIRESAATSKYYACLAEITASYREVDSPLGVSIEAISLDTNTDLADHLDAALARIRHHIRNRVVYWASVLPSGQSVAEWLPGFERELQVVFVHVHGKNPSSPTANFGSSDPVFYTQRESFKFSDHVCNALGQLRGGMANVLAVLCHSTTHEPEEAEAALHEMEKRAASGDDEFFKGKKLLGAQDYIVQLRNLSAVVVCSKWISVSRDRPQNCVWPNPKAACPLSTQQLLPLEAM